MAKEEKTGFKCAINLHKFYFCVVAFSRASCEWTDTTSHANRFIFGTFAFRFNRMRARVHSCKLPILTSDRFDSIVDEMKMHSRRGLCRLRTQIWIIHRENERENYSWMCELIDVNANDWERNLNICSLACVFSRNHLVRFLRVLISDVTRCECRQSCMHVYVVEYMCASIQSRG